MTSESSSLSVKSITSMCSSSQQAFNGVLVRGGRGDVWCDFVAKVFMLVVGVAGAGGCGWKLQGMASSLLPISDRGYDSSIDVCWSLSESSAHAPVTTNISHKSK